MKAFVRIGMLTGIGVSIFAIACFVICLFLAIRDQKYIYIPFSLFMILGNSGLIFFMNYCIKSDK